MQMTRTNSAIAFEAGLTTGIAAITTALWQRPARALRRLIDHERTLLALENLSDDQLKDIGLRRYDLPLHLKAAAARR
jgi:uncharacterized protein YjiS (DUF1127 family)